jgi:hypothetical protein
MSLTTGEKTYEYMYIIQNESELKIVKPSSEIEVLKVKIEYKDSDYREALKKVQEMEVIGWELVLNQITSPGALWPRNYFLMRKGK